MEYIENPFKLEPNKFESHITEWIADLLIESRGLGIEVSSITSWFQYIRSIKDSLNPYLYRYLSFYVCEHFDLYIEHLPSRTDIFGTPEMFNDWIEQNVNYIMSIDPPAVLKAAIGYILMDIRMSQLIKGIDNTHQINVMKLFLFKTVVNYYKYREVRKKRRRVSDCGSSSSDSAA